MSIRLTDEELSKVTAIRQEVSLVSQQYGQLAFTRHMLEEEIKQVEQKFSDLLKKEDEVVKTLSAKYGNGTLDLSSGEFNPTV